LHKVSENPASAINYQNHYDNEYLEALVEIAKSFLKILSEQLVDKTIMIAAMK
jgi:hypothetical protein